MFDNNWQKKKKQTDLTFYFTLFYSIFYAISRETHRVNGHVYRLKGERLKKRWKDCIIVRKAISTSMNRSLNDDTVHVS